MLKRSMLLSLALLALCGAGTLSAQNRYLPPDLAEQVDRTQQANGGTQEGRQPRIDRVPDTAPAPPAPRAERRPTRPSARPAPPAARPAEDIVGFLSSGGSPLNALVPIFQISGIHFAADTQGYLYRILPGGLDPVPQARLIGRNGNDFVATSDNGGQQYRAIRVR